MARADLRHPANAAGEWFVDTRCIDCGTCRELAPDLFAAHRGTSVVARQPAGAEALGAELAAQACPTQSIGTASRRPRSDRLFPREVEGGVFDCGYTSEASFGATSWFVHRPGEGNLLVDSPRFVPHLERAFAERGGVADVLLTHCDDVADAARWADRFGARVWIHAADRWAAPFATDVLEGRDEVELRPGLVAVPTPGHTRGSVVYVLEDRYLFTGDSLAWSHDSGDLTAFRGACWYSWPEQTASLARLAAGHRFEWVLPGHGARVHLDADDSGPRLVSLVERMRRTP